MAAVGQPRLWLGMECEEVHLTVDAAEDLAAQILALVAKARAALVPF